jgi:outer membrane protein assembly factor BamB
MLVPRLVLLPLMSEFASGSRLLWSHDTGSSVEASPAPLLNADGSTTLFVADYGGTVVGLAAADGSPRGLPRFYEGEMIRCTPATFRFNASLAALFFGAGDGKLYAVDAGSGHLLWAFASGEQPQQYQASSPVVHDAGGGDVRVFAGSVDGHLRALDALTGALLWAAPAGGAVYASPQVRPLANGTVAVVIGSDDGSVRAFAAADGAPLWDFQTNDMVRGSFGFAPLPGGGGREAVVFGSNDDAVYAVSVDTGALVWQFATGGDVTATPTVWANASGAVTAFVGSYDDRLYALDALTGVVRWSVKTFSDVIASAAVVDVDSLGPARVYVGCGGDAVNSLFYALDAATGATAWTYYVENAPIWSSARPVLAGPGAPVIAFGDQTGIVWGLALP